MAHRPPGECLILTVLAVPSVPPHSSHSPIRRKSPEITRLFPILFVFVIFMHLHYVYYCKVSFSFGILPF